MRSSPEVIQIFKIDGSYSHEICTVFLKNPLVHNSQPIPAFAYSRCSESTLYENFLFEHVVNYYNPHIWLL